MSDWCQTLQGLLDHAWQALEDGARDSDAPGRLVTLATVGRNGGPKARTVAQRRADRTAAVIEMHTDATSRKVSELRSNPRAAVHIWLPEDQLQIRMQGIVEVTAGSDADEKWHQVPDVARGNYGVRPAPGTPISSADAFTRTPNIDRFAVLQLRIDTMDLVHLGEPHHRRAGYMRADGWAGQWQAP